MEPQHTPPSSNAISALLIPVPQQTVPAFSWTTPAASDILPNQSSVTPIAFSFQHSVAPHSPAEAVLAHEREKHKKRAERFGVEIKEPAKEVFGIEPKRYENPFGKMALGFDPTSPEQQSRLEKRKARFGDMVPEAADIEVATGEMELDAREPRQEPGPSAAARKEGVYIYGTDQMSTKDIFRYFLEYGPAFVEWINDSSCVVVFEDEYAARRGLLGVCVPQDAVTPPPPEGVAAALPVIPLWYRGRQEWKGQILQMRMATTEDVKSLVPKQSMYYATKFGTTGGGQRRNKKKKVGARAQPTDMVDQEDLNAGRKQKRRRKLKKELTGAGNTDKGGDVIMVDEAEVAKRKKRVLRFQATQAEAHNQ